MLPAHLTKHIPLLIYPANKNSVFRLAQSNDGESNGTALWLGSQCLSVYLASLSLKPGVLLELGSGIGLIPLVMSSAGWHVLATDIPPVLSTVLLPNIEKNPVSSGSIQVRQLDWTVPPGDWLWDNPSIIASHSTSLPSSDPNNLLRPPFDIICTADTVYNPSLIEPLLRTLHALCTISQTATPDARSPPVYICLERRDPNLVERFLANAHDTWNFDVHRIPHRRLVKAMHKAGTTWSKEDWEGIEIWKFTLPKK